MGKKHIKTSVNGVPLLLCLDFVFPGTGPILLQSSYTNLIVQQRLIRHANARKLKHTLQLSYT